MQGRLKRWLAVGVAAALILPLVVLAIVADGYHATKLDLNDAGIWVVNWQRGTMGRINTQIGAIEVAVAAPTKSFDVAQADDTVLLTVPEQKNIVPVDVALATLGQPVTVPDAESTKLGGTTGILSDPESGKVWAVPRQAVTQVDTRNQAPQFAAGGKAVTAVGVDGVAHAYAPGAAEVHSSSPSGGDKTSPVDVAIEAPQVSAVGGQVVLLDTKNARIVLPGQRVVALGADARNPELQQPGPAAPDVLVGTDDALVAVNIASGEVRTLTTGGTRSASPPVRLNGCSFAAWSGTPRYAQVCDGSPPQADNIASMRPGGRMQFRVNRQRVVLNDTATGSNLLFTDDKPIEVNNWDEALNKEKKDQSNQKVKEREKDADCGADATEAKMDDDRAGTRPGRPVIVPVLDNDQFMKCDVPIVTVPVPPPPDAGTVAVIRNGSALQVTPAADRTAPIVFPYEVVTSRGPKQANVTVDIATAGVNSPPVTKEDTTSVVSGKTVRHDVLANDFDPEGDALTLIEAKAPDGGSVTFRSDGQVSYTADGGVTGEKSVTYTVEDELGAHADGTLKVIVTAEDDNVSPTARNDRVVATVGRKAVVDLLANDVDPNGDELQVVSVEAPGDLEAKVEDKGRLGILASHAGSWTFSYTISDGEKTAKAQVRVDAVDPGTNHAPVAVRDDLAARAGIPAYADLVANDLDEDGDLLAVVAVDTPPTSGLSVELLDMHLVRVTAPAGFAEPVLVGYSVSDGQATARGVLLVRPYKTAGVNQAPIAVDDELSVRAGNLTGIPVAENDIDPEGERLTVTRVDPIPASDGQVFVEGDQLRYQAPPTGPATVRFSYTVEDPGGNRADGHVIVRVAPDGQPNQPPRAPELEARAFAGSEVAIPLSLVGLDPDGDVVAVVGVSDPPLKGHAVTSGTGFTYRADAGASGTDTFAYAIRDALGAESTGHVRVAVVPRPTSNSNPVAVPDKRAGKAGSSVAIPVLANDSDPDGDKISLLTDGKDAPSKPRDGDVRVDAAGNGLVYEIPASAPAGDESFSYGITDGRGGSARGVVTVAITTDAPNAPPIARDDAAKVQGPGASVDVDVLANDADPDGDIGSATVAVVTEGVEATVLPNRHIQVKVANRAAQFVYEITDGGGAKARAVVSVPVFDNRNPECDTKTAEVKAGETVAVDVLESCREPEGRKLELVKVLANRGGTVKLDGSRAVFTAAAEVRGDAGFAYVVSNGTTTAIGGVIVHVLGQNFPPVFASTAIDVPAGGDRVVDLAALVTDLNPEDRPRFSKLEGAAPPKIEAQIDGTSARIHTSDDAKGNTATLSLEVSDGVNTVPGQLTVRVLAHDGQPPVAVDDQFETFQEKEIVKDVTANDIDPLGKGLVVKVIGANSGTASVEGDRSIRFTPESGFFGDASVTYEITDAAKDADRVSRATAHFSVIGFPSKPGAPTAVRDSHLVRLEWGAPQANGAPITKYIVETDAGGVSRKESTSNSLVFDGLQNGTPYHFRVLAINKAVENESQYERLWSPWSGVQTPDQVPGTPASPTLKFGDRSIAVAWTPPKVDGTAITNYQVRVSGAGVTGALVQDVGTNTSYDWTGLTNGNTYTFSVRAKNDRDYGEWSLPTNDPVNGIPAAEPGPVPSFAANRLDKDTTAGGWIRLTWDSPLANGDSNFTFVITSSPADVAPITVKNAATRSLDVSGLKNGVTYTFSITAANKAGTGPESTSAPAVPAALPGAVGAVTAAPGDGSATLTFSAPANNGDSIDGWEASINGSASWVAATGAGGQAQGAPVSVTVGGLSNGSTYSFQVRAKNVVGPGGASPASNQVVPFGAPGAPSVSAAVSGTTTITWNWNAPNGNGRPIDHYKVWLDGSPLNFSYTSTSYSQNFGYSQSHTLTVSAVNAGNLESAQGSAGATTGPPPQSVVVSFGGAVTGCGFSPCNRMKVDWSGFGGGSHSLHCHSGNGDVGFVAMTVNGGSGSVETGSGSAAGSQYCFVGTGYGYWVDIDGISSNHINR